MTRRFTTTRWLPVLALGLAAACARQSGDTAGAEGAMPADSTRPGDSAGATTSGQSGVGAGMTGSVTLQMDPSGMYLADSRGRAVYTLENADGTPMTECTGECASTFEPVTGSVTVSGGNMSSSMFSTETTSSGQQVATYNGKRLYFMRNDSGSGQQPPSGGSIRATRVSGH